MQETRAIQFRWRLRVYWEDTDAGGVVFYANYLKFFERGRTEWLRDLGVEQQALRDDTGAIFVVTDTAVQYKQPARLDDVVEVTVRIIDCGNARITIDQEAFRVQPDGAADGKTPGTPGPLLASGRIRIACVDAATFRPRRIPTDILERLTPP